MIHWIKIINKKVQVHITDVWDYIKKSPITYEFKTREKAIRYFDLMMKYIQRDESQYEHEADRGLATLVYARVTLETDNKQGEENEKM